MQRFPYMNYMFLNIRKTGVLELLKHKTKAGDSSSCIRPISGPIIISIQRLKHIYHTTFEAYYLLHLDNVVYIAESDKKT